MGPSELGNSFCLVRNGSLVVVFMDQLVSSDGIILLVYHILALHLLHYKVFLGTKY